jgi:hypothetical protein
MNPKRIEELKLKNHNNIQMSIEKEVANKEEPVPTKASEPRHQHPREHNLVKT